MEEKYPIKFSLGQFILLLGVVFVVLSMIFLLGARFGGFIFPEYYSKQFQTKSPYAKLEPENRLVGGGVLEAAPREDDREGLAEEPGESEEEGDPGAEAPHYQVGADGSARLQDDGNSEAEEEPGENNNLTINRSLIRTDTDRQTVIRFKSSGNSKFTVEVKDYFDELLASRRISQLKGHGYEAYLTIKNPNAQSPSYSVRVGAFSDRKIAEDFARDMSNKENMELRVVEMD